MKKYLQTYLASRPLFLSLIRGREAQLYEKYLGKKRVDLDIGCGDGFFAKTVFSKVGIGLDVADSRIEQSRSENVYKKIVAYDGSTIPLPSKSVSVAVSNCVLEHVDPLQLVIKETSRVLKKRGVFATTVMAKPWEENLVGSMVMGNSYKIWMRKKQVHLNLLTRNEWRAMFEQNGFKIKTEVGYLSGSACRLLDVCHYFSIPSLVTYLLFGKWVLWPRLNILPLDWMVKTMTREVNPEESGALFFVLEKI